jgi:hypothetical protein
MATGCVPIVGVIGPLMEPVLTAVQWVLGSSTRRPLLMTRHIVALGINSLMTLTLKGAFSLFFNINSLYSVPRSPLIPETLYSSIEYSSNTHTSRIT